LEQIAVEQIARSALLSLLFGVLGFAMLFVGLRIFDALMPANVEKKIFEDGNLAAAVMAGAFIIGMAIIIHAAIS
jgi:uncharacterized membrane protein YjfL (UPF0719 family)